jgi:hypothetical protein
MEGKDADVDRFGHRLRPLDLDGHPVDVGVYCLTRGVAFGVCPLAKLAVQIDAGGKKLVDLADVVLK